MGTVDGRRLDPTLARGRAAVSDALADLDPGTPVLLGVSGGADSLALAALTAFVAPRAGLVAAALVVDHGLQDGSAAVAARAAGQVNDLGIAARTVRVAVDGTGGPEAAARAARRTALEREADDLGAPAILLAHTRDDQAETVLLGLARGAGARSLAGMARRTGRWRRPLLDLTRADTEAVCLAAGVAWWDDPHNVDARYARVRVRTEALPSLERALGPGVAAALARTADRLRDDADLLDELADEAYAAVVVDGRVDATAASVLPRALRTRVLRRAAVDAGVPAGALSAAHVAALDGLVSAWRGQGGPTLPGGVVATRTGATVVLAAGA